MNDDIIDLLRIKIERAKTELPAETLNAIASVDWRAAILQMRAKRGYTFEQLGDLELETELLLCGLVSPEGYPKELEKRMGISKASANELVNEMNDLVFKKIKEELIKNTERKKIFANREDPALRPPLSKGRVREGSVGGEGNASLDKGRLEGFEEKKATQVLNLHGIEITEKKETLPIPEKLELKEKMHPILTQKLSNPFQIPTVKTDHSLQNLQPPSGQNGAISKKMVDPYREAPE